MLQSLPSFCKKLENLVTDRHRYANNLVPVAGLDGVVPWSFVSGTATQKFLTCYVHIQRIKDNCSIQWINCMLLLKPTDAI